MCRWIAYNGQPMYMEQLVTMPDHSLVEQSLHTRMNVHADGSIWNTNGDGFGIGWYAERPEPGLFKDESPAWSNKNLYEICTQVRARIFFAHIRATTTGAVQRSNCHPFKQDNWLFQHNGMVSDFEVIRRDLQMDIAPELYPELKGTTDSETFFLLAMTYGLKDDPKAALQKMVKRIQKAAKDNGTEGVLNLSCAMSDGRKTYTIRYADNDKPKTQFYAIQDGWVEDIDIDGKKVQEKGVVIVSEPLDQIDDGHWNAIPENTFTTSYKSEITIEDFM